MRLLGPRLATNYHPQPTVGFMNPSILAGGGIGLGGTLRRPRIDNMSYDTAPPRILSKIDIEPQFYYGWPLLNNKILVASSSIDSSAPLSPITTAAASASAAANPTYISHALAASAAMHGGSTSSPKNGNTMSMQKLDRTDTPTMSLSMSSPTSTMLAKKSKNSQLSEHEQQQQQNNKNTVVLCPPSRTYCF